MYIYKCTNTSLIDVLVMIMHQLEGCTVSNHFLDHFLFAVSQQHTTRNDSNEDRQYLQGKAGQQ